MKSRDKFTILRALKNAPEDIKSMTVGQLIDKISKEQSEIENADKEECKKVCEEFKGAYIKVLIKDGTFGPESQYMYIKDIQSGSMTTEYERLFDINGKRISFSRLLSSCRDMKFGCVNDLFTADQLRCAEKISKEDFEYAERQSESMEKIINEMNK